MKAYRVSFQCTIGRSCYGKSMIFAVSLDSVIGLFHKTLVQSTLLLLCGLFIRIAAPLAISRCIPGKLSRCHLPAIVLDTVNPFAGDDAVGGLQGTLITQSGNKEY